MVAVVVVVLAIAGGAIRATLTCENVDGGGPGVTVQLRLLFYSVSGMKSKCASEKLNIGHGPGPFRTACRGAVAGVRRIRRPGATG